MSDSRLPKQAYKMQLKLDENLNPCWVTRAKNFLCDFGFTDVWQQQGVGDERIRGRAHCKILRKYCIFGCRTHFGHIAASPYAKWLNIDSASYGLLVAAASLNTRSICKLRVISAVAPHSSPAQVHSMKRGICTTKSTRKLPLFSSVWRYPTPSRFSRLQIKTAIPRTTVKQLTVIAYS